MPSIIFADGFDTYTTILDKWNVITQQNSPGLPTIIPGSGRGGAGALNFLPGRSGFNSQTSSIVKKNVGAQTTLFIGFAFNWNPTGQVQDLMVVQFFDGSTTQVALWISATGVMYFTRSNNSVGGAPTLVLGTASIAYPSNSYHYVEIKVVISSTVGVCQLKVDQTIVPGMNLTGLNTNSSGTPSLNSVGFGQDSGPSYIGGSPPLITTLYDDIYFDTAGFNGDNRIAGLLPTGNGTTQNFLPVEAAWVAATVTRLQTTIFDGTNLQRCTSITGTGTTGGSAPTWNGTLGGTTTDNAGANQVIWTNIGTVAHWKLVNETDPDSDSSYVQSNTVNDIERYTYPAISGANIAAVLIQAFARKDDGGFRTIQGAIKSGGTLGTTGTDVAPGSNYAYLMLQSLTDPNTGSAWTLAAVNAAEFGVKITN